MPDLNRQPQASQTPVADLLTNAKTTAVNQSEIRRALAPECVMDQNQIPQQPNTNQSPAPEQPPVEVSSAPAPEAPASDLRQPKVLTIPSNAMAQIKREEREKGKKTVLSELEARAKKAGFDSIEDMERAATMAKRHRQNPAPRSAPAPRTPTPPAAEAAPAAPDQSRVLRRAERERERALEEARKHNRARASEEKRRKDAERRLSAMEAEMALRTEAVRAGVRDVDYALELLRRKIHGRSPDELRSFNETEFFAKELRSSHPYLYGVEDVPVQTAAPDTKARPATQQAAPRNGQPAAPEAPNGALVDARKLTPDQYSEMLKKYGIKNPTAGL